MMTSDGAAPTGRQILATDLDGTLIPIDGDVQNRSDLQKLAEKLKKNKVTLVFVTGRHFASVLRAMEEFQLPSPDWVICDVGTSIYARQAAGEFMPVEAYYEHQDRIIAKMSITVLRGHLQSIEGLRLQDQEKQGRFKLSYYANAAQLDELTARIQQELDKTNAPYSIIHSVDPFNGDGLIDLLPATVSKAHALDWWAEHAQLSAETIVFAGDSGNDLAALTAGHRAIVVANADRAVVQRAYKVHREAGWQNRLFLAKGKATSGVLEGCRWFEFFALDEQSGVSFQLADGRGSQAGSVRHLIDRLGATPVSYNQTHFRVWAPKRQRVDVEVLDGETTQRHSLMRDEHGYFTGVVSNARPHALYQYVLDDQQTRPDPVSRYQPNGVHGASEIINPDAFPWTDSRWKGVAKRDLIIYELHIGAFTQEGSFHAAMKRLPELVELGVTAVEVMPVAQSPGRWNWGYDGVDLFAVRNTYGEPDDFKAFVDACHMAGLAVILDVVYNHVGPEGNYLADYGPYFSRQHRTPWGEAFNYDGEDAKHVRSFITDNAVFWLDEFHLDGLRLDAVHLMLDDSDLTILDEIRLAVSEFARAVDREIHLIAEANVYDQDLLAANESRESYDAIWCDCLMHAIYSHALPNLQLTHREYRGANDLAEVLQFGYVHAFAEGQHSRVPVQQRKEIHKNRNPISSLVTALQTHDSVGNHPHGKRIHHLTSKSFQKAVAALTLLYPSIPLIFMGEEYASDSPFPFFVDFEDERLRKAVDTGRPKEYPQHSWRGALLPSDPQAFHNAKCDNECDRDAEMFNWYRDLIKLRKEGIAKGWLSPACMTTRYDADQQIFTLQFNCEDHEVLVQVRLAAVHQQDVKPVRVAVEGTEVLSCERNLEMDKGYFLLQPNDAIVSKSDAVKQSVRSLAHPEQGKK